MTDSVHQASRRGAANLGKTLVSQPMTLAVLTVSGFLIPRFLGVEAFGLYAAAMAIITMLQAGSTLGLQQVQLRYLPPLWRTAENRPEAERLASSIWTVRLAVSLLAGVLAFLWLHASPELGFGPLICILLGALCLFRCAEQATRNFFLPFGHAGKSASFELLRVSLNLAVILFLYPRYGLPGVFAGLAVTHLALAALDSAVLMRILPVRLTVAHLQGLYQFRSYSLASYVGQLASSTQSQFTVYAVAAWVTPHQAGILAVAVQLHNLARDLYLSARRSLMPILAELEDAGEERRLGYWGGIILRYGAAVGTVGLVSWSLLGDWVVYLLLTEDFAAVYPVASVVLLGVVLFFCGGACVGLLYTKGLAGVVAVNTVVYALAAAIGLLVVVYASPAATAGRIAWVFVASAAVYWAGAYIALGRLGGLWLPMGRTLGLLSPILVAIPAVYWTVGPWTKLLAFAAFLPSYAVLSMTLGLLPAHEIRQVFETMRRAH